MIRQGSRMGHRGPCPGLAQTALTDNNRLFGRNLAQQFQEIASIAPETFNKHHYHIGFGVVTQVFQQVHLGDVEGIAVAD
jgi:hypothetical protein